LVQCARVNVQLLPAGHRLLPLSGSFFMTPRIS
jgi:hypothetical protein